LFFSYRAPSQIIPLARKNIVKSVASLIGGTSIQTDKPLGETTADDDIDPEKVIEKKESLALTIKLQGFGLSVVDSTPLEMLYITLQNLRVEFNQSNTDESICISIES